MARAVASEVRAAMGRQRISANQLARLTNLSQNYISKRLRDEAPFTLNDVELICQVLKEDYVALMVAAGERLEKEAN